MRDEIKQALGPTHKKNAPLNSRSGTADVALGRALLRALLVEHDSEPALEEPNKDLDSPAPGQTPGKDGIQSSDEMLSRRPSADNDLIQCCLPRLRTYYQSE